MNALDRIITLEPDLPRALSGPPLPEGELTGDRFAPPFFSGEYVCSEGFSLSSDRECIKETKVSTTNMNAFKADPCNESKNLSLV